MANRPLLAVDASVEDCLPSVTLPAMVRYFLVKGQLSDVGVRTTVFFCKNVIAVEGRVDE